MCNKLISLPEKIQRQIINITKFSSFTFNEESIEKIAELWILKENLFLEELKKNNMIEIDFIDANNKSASIIMTYSGSLLKLSPEKDGERTIEYTSLGLRTDVPDHLVVNNVKLAYDIIKDEPIDFKQSKLKTTSPVYKIGICKENLSEEDQLDSVDKFNDFILKSFIEFNREYLKNK